MLDIKYIRENKEKVKQACKNKNLDDSIVDKLLDIDEKRRSLQTSIDKIRQKINEISHTIKQQTFNKQKPDQALIDKAKELKKSLKDLNEQYKDIEAKFKSLMYEIPNVPAHDTPIGEDESFNVPVRYVGEKTKFDFEVKPYFELMEDLDMVDTKRGVKVAGFRGYFLKNFGLLMEQAILNYALKFMLKQGFTPMSAPILVKQDFLWGTGYFPWGLEDHYKIDEDYALAGTAEVALTSYYAGEVLKEKDLPVKMVGISPCFRKEVGSYGKDTKGVFRVHQFNKVEQVVLTVADEQETRKWHEKMLSFSEKLLQDLKLPYRVLNMCTGDMGAGQRKKYDIEVWFPYQNKYRETHSASYFNDFQARRLNIRYQAKDGKLKYVYTLNNTVIASPRIIAAIVENYQQKDGSVKVPEVLQDFVGTDVIKKLQ